MIKVIWPEYISLKDWAAALVTDYPNEYLPLLEDENNWQEWGTIVISTGMFERAGIPAPFSIAQGLKKDNFENWQAWAKVVYTNLSNEV
jgi:hypothetical protein